MTFHQVRFMVIVFGFMLLGLFMPRELDLKFFAVMMAGTALIAIPQIITNSQREALELRATKHSLVLVDIGFAAMYGAALSAIKWLLSDSAGNPEFGMQAITSAGIYLCLITGIVIYSFREIGVTDYTWERRSKA